MQSSHIQCSTLAQPTRTVSLSTGEPQPIFSNIAEDCRACSAVLFTNIYVLRSCMFNINYFDQILYILFLFWLICTTNVLTFWLPANVYLYLYHCWSIGWFPRKDVRLAREYCNTLPREQGVCWYIVQQLYCTRAAHGQVFQARCII